MIALEVISPSYNRLQAVASSVPIATRGLVHVWGRNDMATHQMVGMFWEVKDPDGNVVDRYGPDWEGMTPGEADDFIGGRFDLNKEGTYTIKIELLMNPDSPVVVDSYEGDLCTVTLEVPPEYELLEETIYPYAYIYDGPHDGGIFTFKTDPFTPADWIAGRLAQACEDEVRKAGGKMLEMRVYVDKTPLFWADWRIDVVSVPPKGIATSIGYAWWVIAILAILLIALIIVITWAAKEIAGLFKRNPALADVKPGWGKETLILTIHDSEEYWERPLTPVETLEGMSEQELRDYLDQIAEEEVPPEAVSPWALVIIGGVAVLGVGAVVALAARRKG